MTTVWLAANYHFPSTYSCRIPMSSMNSTLVTPAPGPATVRLALIRTGIELFGVDVVREDVFPLLRSLTIRIRPPERVAISQQPLRAYKWDAGKAGMNDRSQESVIIREMAHAEGLMTLYVEVPSQEEERFRALLNAVGYWGQTSSLTYCIEVVNSAPASGECALPLSALDGNHQLKPFFSCVLSEFRDHQLVWEEIVPTFYGSKSNALSLTIYVWPMLIARQQNGNKLLIRDRLT